MKITKMTRFPLNIQLFAEGEGGTPPAAATPPAVATPASGQGYTQEQLDTIAEARASRASEAALKDFFKQQGLSQQEITAALDKYKVDKAASTPDPQKIQSELAAAQQNAALAQLDKQATLKALELGIDVKQIEYVLKLADIKLPENGEVKDEDIETALKAVLEAVPAFKPQAPIIKPGFVLGADGKQQRKHNTGNVSMYDAIAAKLGK